MRNLHYEKFQDGTIKCIEDQIPFDVPEGWCWSKINTIAFVTKLAGFEYTKNIAPNLCENGVPLFKGKNVHNSTVIYEFESYIPESISDELQRSQITRKCILTPYVGTIGNIGIHNRPGKYHLGSNVGKIELYNSNATILEEYVVAYLQSKYGYQQLTKHMKATAQASISIAAIRDVYLPIPPADEQYRIQNILSHALSLIDCIQTSELDIKELIMNVKSKILDIAIRGKLVPQDPNDEPASVLLERIRSKKKDLINQGKLKCNKKESVIFKGDDNSYYEKYDEKIPMGWAITNFETLLSYEQPTNYIVRNTAYKNEYNTPVLTAGKSFILGYTNEEDNIFSDFPVIIFDDFTTESKYVDFPFKVKSSAMKILHINTDCVLPMYAYYLMQATQIDHDNHQRYWISTYSQELVALPPINEQKRILSALGQYFVLLEMFS